MIPDRNDATVAEGIALLTEQFKGKPNIEALLSAGLRRVQTLEDEVWIAIWAWVLDYAEFQQLDDLGAIVGQAREGRTDDQYRYAIRVRIRVNRSKGRAEDVLQVATLLDAAATYVEYFPLAWEVSIYSTTEGGHFIRLLTQAKAASSYGVLLTSSWAESAVFKFDHAGASANVWGTANSGGPDVRWPAALPTNPGYRFT